MNWISQAIEFATHLDVHLNDAIRQYGSWTYGILFGIVFCETGLVIAPFLPGDTLLFAAGLISSWPGSPLNFWILYIVFMAAALSGDNVNYQVGRVFGRKLFRNEKSRIFKKSNLDKTHEFFERHGGKTIILARFVPIIRTFAPFVAGMGAMTFGKFIGFSVFAAWFWVFVCMGAGFVLGEAVKDNFALAILGLVVFSLVPYGIEGIRYWLRRRAKRAKAAVGAAAKPAESTTD